MDMLRHYIGTCFVLQFFLTDAARILAYYPIPSVSHQIVFQSITLELIKHGHEVVVITPNPMYPKGQAPKNLTEIDVHDISYTVWEDFMASAKGHKEDLITQIKVGVRVILKTVEEQLKVKEVKKLIKGQEKFDLLLAEACVRSALAFTHPLRVPAIQISSFGAVFGNYETMGAPEHPFLYQQTVNQRLYNLTKYEKLYELYNDYMTYRYLSKMEDDENKMIQRIFGPDTPSMRALLNNVHMLLLNVHPIWEGNRPVPPGVIHMGGLPQKPNKELPAVS